MDRIQIIDFLIRAKKATYAGNGRSVQSSRLGSRDLAYRENHLIYHDSYFGGSQFIGEEVVCINEVPFWCMNYAGYKTDESFSFDFLKEALRMVSAEAPFRGPAEYAKADDIYSCSIQGDFDWFQGVESIEHQGRVVYRGCFHGGIIR